MRWNLSSIEHTEMPSYMYSQEHSKIALSIVPISLIRIGLYVILLVLTLQTNYQISTEFYIFFALISALVVIFVLRIHYQ